MNEILTKYFIKHFYITQVVCRISMGLWTDSWLVQQLSTFKQSFFSSFSFIQSLRVETTQNEPGKSENMIIERLEKWFWMTLCFLFSSTFFHRKRLLWEQLSAVLVQGSLVNIFGFNLLNIRTPVLLFCSEMNWTSQSDSYNTESGTEIMWLVIMSTFSKPKVSFTTIMETGSSSKGWINGSMWGWFQFHR